MPLNIPPKAQDAFQNNMSDGQKIELPFPTPAFYVINGDAKLAALKNFQYFGGWACNADKVKDASESWQNCPFPVPGYGTAEIPQDNGMLVNVIASRFLTVAPIGMRQYSSIFDPATGKTRRVPPFTKGARPGVQVLVLLGYKGEGGIMPWAPVLLTAKGYQTNHIQSAFTNWRKAIKPHVQKLAPGSGDSALNLFWMRIGTFGEQRKQELVGSGTNQKTITPITAFVPEDLTTEQVEKQYVGENIAEFMADISSQAQEWLNVFKQPAAATGPVAGHIDIDDDYLPPPDDSYDPPF